MTDSERTAASKALGCFMAVTIVALIIACGGLCLAVFKTVWSSL